jgi:hypothetical protein
MAIDTVETVNIVVPVTADNSSGFVVINKSDFNAEVHKLFGEVKVEAKTIVAEVEKVEAEVVVEIEKVTGWGAST